MWVADRYTYLKVWGFLLFSFIGIASYGVNIIQSLISITHDLNTVAIADESSFKSMCCLNTGVFNGGNVSVSSFELGELHNEALALKGILGATLAIVCVVLLASSLTAYYDQHIMDPSVKQSNSDPNAPKTLPLQLKTFRFFGLIGGSISGILVLGIMIAVMSVSNELVEGTKYLGLHCCSSMVWYDRVFDAHSKINSLFVSSVCYGVLFGLFSYATLVKYYKNFSNPPE
jgi:hypothetical protein